MGLPTTKKEYGITLTESKEYSEHGDNYRDVIVPGLPLKIFAIKLLTGRRLELTNLHVGFQKAGKGHGKKAIVALLHWARCSRIKSIHLESVEDSVGFWEKQGFYRTNTPASESDWVRMTKKIA